MRDPGIDVDGDPAMIETGHVEHQPLAHIPATHGAPGTTGRHGSPGLTRPRKQPAQLLQTGGLRDTGGNDPVNPGAFGICGAGAEVLPNRGKKRGAFHPAKS
jgi:hypothetical protein